MVYAQITLFYILFTFANVIVVAKCSLFVSNILCMLLHQFKRNENLTAHSVLDTLRNVQMLVELVFYLFLVI